MKKTKRILTVVKIVGGIVISIGVGAVTANLIKATTPKDVRKLTKICIGVGSFFVARTAATAASDKFDHTMDSIIKMVTKFMEITKDDQQKEEVVIEGET
jgi:NAD/NADP transhydrogenase beta subunit